MIKRTIFVITLLFIAFSSFSMQNDIYPKNIIFFVSDGMGYNHVDATSYYQYGNSGKQIYESQDWVKLGVSTYPAVIGIDGNDTIYAAGYNPREASKNHKYVKSDYTDSGAAATSLSTGKKVYSGSIGIGLKGDTLFHIAQAAKSLGKSTGVVASVPLSHATPAGFIAHNNHRGNYQEIARYMLFNTKLDLIFGTGNPLYDNNGNLAQMDGFFVGGTELWKELRKNKGQTVFNIDGETYSVRDATGNGKIDPWYVIESKEDFLKFSEKETSKRILGVPEIYLTLQQRRELLPEETKPFEAPLVETVPSLEEMTEAALNILSQNEKGFFVMIEGGAVDWASHRNQLGRMIEEQIDFNKSVESAVEWVEKHSSWEETLIIVTSDHECGYLTGPGKPDPLYPNIINKGKGNLPGMQWNSGTHTNKLVPLYAKGHGAEFFKIAAGEYDPKRGAFLQNTQIPQVIFMLWN